MVGAAERAGHRVLEAVDGAHAVTAATRYVPDLLIADAVLPHLDTALEDGRPPGRRPRSPLRSFCDGLLTDLLGGAGDARRAA